ncbi:MAG: family 43 glycosylhydrolase, partial [Fibrobacteres bacterium]|nr:family 43 glycosylhydrolase [Fibrobacterota bacterium]
MNILFPRHLSPVIRTSLCAFQKTSNMFVSVVLSLLVLAATTAPLSAQAAGGAEKSLLLRYQFEETGGTTVVDSSGHGFDGTYINPPAWDAGVTGRSFKMNGGAPGSPTAAHVKIPGGVLNGLDAMTIATWVKWEGEGPWQWLYGLGMDGNKYIFATPRSGDGALYSAIKDGGAEQSLHGNVALENGKWRHLAVTISATGSSVLYLDGEKVAENNNVTIRPSALHAAGGDYSGYIGKSFYPDPYFRGAVDDFRIYSAALTAAQVGDIYGEGMPAAQVVALVKSNLTIGRAIVVNDLSLPASSQSVSITWKSSNPALVGHNGAVKRPAKGQPVGVVTLTAFISKEGVTATKVFNLNVPPVGYPLKFESYNPVLKRDAEGNRLFTADPAVLVDGDTLYIYAGRDEAAIGGWFNMNEWVCYSTKDMVDWKYEGVVLKATDFAWGSPGTAWACQVVKRHGKYFLYSTTGRPDRQGYTVGVAVSDKPTGPFIDAIGGPLFDNAITTGSSVEGIEDIDPTVFVDDDGQAYLYWGNSTLHYALLNEDMISLKDLNGDGKITEGADIISRIEIKDRPMGFGEGPWLYKAKGKYYLVDAMGMPQKVVYAMSDSPRGPWQYKGVILDENVRPDGSRGDFSSDTSHPAVIEFKGQWYVFYHNAALPTGGQTRRS